MVSNRTRFLLAVIVCFKSLTLTAQNTAGQKLFTSLPSSVTGVGFRNDINEDEKMFYYLYEYLYIGAGVGIGDFNNDGLPDLYFSSTRGSNKLYLNEGSFHFKDITLSAGVDGGEGIKTGVNVVDINNDGYLDILVCKSGYADPKLRKKILYINNHDLTFTDKAAAYGLNDDSYTTQAYFFDYDNDGDKDVLFVNHPHDFNDAMSIPATMKNGKMVYAEDTAVMYVSDRLYENRNGHFFDVTKKAGLLSHAFGLSASIFDFNNDGWPDIYIANDFNKPDFLYINNKNGSFTDKLSSYVNHISFSSMGSDVSDINNDGYEDLFVADMAIEDPVRQKQLFVLNVNYDKFQLLKQFNLFYQYPHNVLQLNNGDHTFSEMAYHAGVAQTDWSWAPLIADYDNDGFKDMYITNGLKRDISDWDYKEFVLDSVKNLMRKGQSVNLNEWFKQIPSVKIKNYIYHNNGTLKFDNYTDNWTDEPASFSNGAAYADLDNDGDLDMVVNNVDDEAFILKNNSRESGGNNFIGVKFFKSPGSNEEVYGASVKITIAGKIQVQHYDPQRGYMSTMQHQLNFGIGKQSIIPTIEITFPSKKMFVLTNTKPNQVITIYESNAIAQPDLTVLKAPAKKIFTDISSQSKFKFTHKENEFIDFKREPLIPYECSRKGPYFAKADVNGDKRDDIFIGGAAGVPGKLMLQAADGSFTESIQDCFTKDKAFEDNGVLFFDADGDGDNDLYVSSGGAEFDAGDKLYQDRLYINDGKGKFSRAFNALPVETNNNSCVTALDFDGDGDLDLFVGGAVKPGRFPLHDNSMLLQNTKGIFKDVSNGLLPGINMQGIVNAACWEDIDADQQKELIIAGEWMAPTVFKWNKIRFEKMNTGMEAYSGWWNCIRIADVDNDGDMDIIAGNRGTNSRVVADLAHPCTIYAKDFDGNGSYDAVMGYYSGDKCYPMFSRDQLIDQMPMFRKKYVRYHYYAGKTMEEIFTPEQQKGMDIFKTANFESGVFINDGKGNFQFRPFPELAQLSTINDIVTADFNGDGIPDILAGGNSEDADVATGNYDATAAILLIGHTDGTLTAMKATAGLSMKGEVRRIIYIKEKNTVVFLKNNAAAQVMQKQ